MLNGIYSGFIEKLFEGAMLRAVQELIKQTIFSVNRRERTMKRLITTTLLASSLMFTANAMAGDAAAGKAKSAVCAACHGAAGKAAVPNYPNLAGQNKAYLISSLKAYKNKERSGGMAAIMQGQAAALSDQDIENLAEYYSSLK